MLSSYLVGFKKQFSLQQVTWSNAPKKNNKESEMSYVHCTIVPDSADILRFLFWALNAIDLVSGDFVVLRHYRAIIFNSKYIIYRYSYFVGCFYQYKKHFWQKLIHVMNLF